MEEIKMKISKPKKQLFETATIYYVSSRSGGDRHIVVKNSGTFFCDCRDFVTRHLPLFGTSGFSLCGHGTYVRDRAIPCEISKKKSTKKFGVFFTLQGKPCRSGDLPKTYKTAEAAQKAINDMDDLYTERFVQEIK